MKIKSIEDYTLEECEEYLRFYPDGQDRAAVEDRLKELKENKSKHKPEAIDTKWIDKRQFKDDNEKCFRPNPFKEKSLEDFTIADCESYINRYPYGEHILEVKAHHRKLNSALAKIINLTQDVKKIRTIPSYTEKAVRKKNVNKENMYKLPISVLCGLIGSLF